MDTEQDKLTPQAEAAPEKRIPPLWSISVDERLDRLEDVWRSVVAKVAKEIVAITERVDRLVRNQEAAPSSLDVMQGRIEANSARATAIVGRVAALDETVSRRIDSLLRRVRLLESPPTKAKTRPKKKKAPAKRKAQVRR